MNKEFDASKPLKNKKWEKFVVNMLTMSKPQAYKAAGYKQTGDNASKAAYSLITRYSEVSKRYEYLISKHNEELEKQGFISRESMLKKAIHAMNCCLGEKPVIKANKHTMTVGLEAGADIDGLPPSIQNFIKENGIDESNLKDFSTTFFDEQEVHEYDLKSFAAIWDRIMKAMAYYPEDKVKIEVAKVKAKIEIEKHTGAGKGKNKLAEAARKNYEKRKKEDK